MFHPSKPASYRRLIPESPAKCHIDQALYQRAMLELDPDWARDIHCLLDREIAEAICFVWQTVEDYLRGRYGITCTLEVLMIHADGAIEVEMRQHEQFDSVKVPNLLCGPPPTV